MDRLGLKRQSRILLDEIGVELRTARHARQADAVARRGQIGRGEKIAHPALGGDDHVADLRRIGGGQPGAVGGRNGGGKFLDRRIEGRLLRLARQQIVELRDHVANDQLGLDDAALHTLSKATDRFVEQPGIFDVALQVVLVIDHRIERCGALTRSEFGIEGLDAIEMIHRPHDRQRDDSRVQTFQRHLGLVAEYVIGDLIGRSQLGTVNPPQLRHILLRGRAFGRDIAVGEKVADLIGAAHIPPEDAVDRIAREASFVALMEKPLEPRVFGAVTRLGRSGRQGLGQNRRGHGGKRQGGEQGSEKQKAQADFPFGQRRPIGRNLPITPQAAVNAYPPLIVRWSGHEKSPRSIPAGR